MTPKVLFLTIRKMVFIERKASQGKMREAITEGNGKQKASGDKRQLVKKIN